MRAVLSNSVKDKGSVKMIRCFGILLKNKWIIRPLLLLLLIDFGHSFPLFAQSFFPMPDWFKENVGRHQTYDQPREVSDYLNTLVKDGQLRLTESDAVRLVLQNNLDLVVDLENPRIAEYAITHGYGIFDPKLILSPLVMNRSNYPQNNAVTSGTVAYDLLTGPSKCQFLPTSSYGHTLSVRLYKLAPVQQ